MEIRTLKYFLAVAKEKNFTKAAESVHTTQPNLSRQIQALEDEFGQKLILRGERGQRKTTLTEAGAILQKRALEIIDLCEKTETEMLLPSDCDVCGEVLIGAGESYTLELLATAAKEIQTQYPHVKFNLTSSDSSDITDKIDKGLLDFGFMVGPSDTKQYASVKLPLVDTWGVLMRKDAPLAAKKFVTPSDLLNVPLIVSKPIGGKNQVTEWLNVDVERLNVVARYNLIYNASLLVESGLGYAIGIDRLINTTDTNLCFRFFEPQLTSQISLVWKKHQVFSKASQLFLSKIKELCLRQKE